MTQLTHVHDRASQGVNRWYATQIAATCRKGDWAAALQLLRSMHEQRLQAGAATCNRVIMTCIENKELDSALMALGIMRAMDVVPDANIYSTLIRICEKRSLAETAWHLFQDMKTNGLRANLITYNALIRAAEELKMPYRQVEEVLMQMKEMKVQLDINSYNALISVSLADSTRPDSIQVAIDLFVELHEAGLTPNVITYKTLFGVLREDADGMLKDDGIFKEMERRGILPDISTYNSLISSCERGKHPERALILFDALRKQGLQPDRATYNALLGICRKKKQPERAARLLESMQEAGIDPDIDTYNSLISACVRKDQAELAIQYFQDLQARGLEPNLSTFNAVFSALTRREVPGERLDRLLQSMACYGLVPDRTTYGHLLSACQANRDAQRAVKCLQMMRAHGIPVDGDIHDIISSMGIAYDMHQEEDDRLLEHNKQEQEQPIMSPTCTDKIMADIAVDQAALSSLLATWKLLQIPHKAPPGLTPQFPLCMLMGNNLAAY